MKKVLLVLILFKASFYLNAQNAPQISNSLPKLRLQEYSTGYVVPLDIEHSGPMDDRLFIVEKGGKIWICDAAGIKSATPFLNITSRVKSTGSEQGLLGLVFDPAYASNGFFYVNYTNLQGNTRISRFRVTNNPNLASTAEVIMLTQVQPFTNHKGGQLKFGPDGYLYIALGDGGGAGDPFNNGQDPNTFLGKLLRIDVSYGSNGKQYSIPPTNPYVTVSGWKKEIWASGLRNPFRFSFDRMNGDLWLSDVGQDDWEEINWQKSTSTGGQNYGWGCYEGCHFFKDNCGPNGVPPTFPVAEYPHALSFSCAGSITGGYVYRGTEFSKMYGKYIYTDYCTGIFRAVYKDHDVWVNRYITTQNSQSYSSFGEDMNGELYVADVQQGKIFHVVDSSAMPIKINGNRSFMQNQNSDDVSLFPNPNTGQFTVELSAAKQDIYKLRVVNELGQEVWSERISIVEGINQINVSSDKFSTGIYILQIFTSDAIMSKKFSIQ